MLLAHFGNNAVVFVASLFKVADRMKEQRDGYRAVLDRVAQRQRQRMAATDASYFARRDETSSPQAAAEPAASSWRALAGQTS